MRDHQQQDRPASFHTSPAEALHAEPEQLLYVACLHEGTGVDKAGLHRRRLVVPGLRSSRIHFVNVADDPRRPYVEKVIEPEELVERPGTRGPTRSTACRATASS